MIFYHLLIISVKHTFTYGVFAVKLDYHINPQVDRMSYAIIDIGSNALKTVVYEEKTLGARELYNSKFETDISSLLVSSDLSVDHCFYRLIEYVLNIFKELEVQDTTCVATAMFRASTNAARLCNIVEQRYGLKIDTIDGEQEARYAAQGLIMSIQNADGMIADFGGGSLELAEVKDRVVGLIGSWSLVFKSHRDRVAVDQSHLLNFINNRFLARTYDTLYLIGGSFKSLIKLYKQHSRYPLRSMHNISFPEPEISAYLEYLLAEDTKELRYAIVTLQVLIKAFKPRQITISNYGLKEGVWYASLPPEEKVQYLLLAQSRKIAQFEKKFDIALYKPLFDACSHNLWNKELATILELAVIYHNLAIGIEPSSIHFFLTQLVLNSKVAFSSWQRIMLAITLFFMYRHNNLPTYIENIANVLTPSDYLKAQIAGNMLGLVYTIKGSIYDPRQIALVSRAGFIVLEAPLNMPKTVFYKSREYLVSLGRLLKSFSEAILPHYDDSFSMDGDRAIQKVSNHQQLIKI